MTKKNESKVVVEENQEEPVVKELLVEEKEEAPCKKRKKFGIGFLFGLIVGVLSCIGILLWHGFTQEIGETTKCNVPTEAEDKENGDSSKDTSLSKDSEIAKVLMKQLEKYDELPYFYFDLGREEIINQDLLYFALGKIGYKDSFSLADVEEVISTYFVNTVKPENIACRKNFHEKTEYLYLYDAKNKKFTYNEEHGGHGAGHVSPYRIYNRFVSLKEEGDTYELVVYRAYSSLAEDTGIGEDAYYASYKDAYNEKNVLFKVDYDYDNDFKLITNIDAELEKIEEKKLSKETFTFIKKDNRYLLSGYELK